MRDRACPLEQFLERPGKGNYSTYTERYQEKSNTNKFH